MYWRIFTDASTPEKAKKVMGWVVAKLAVSYREEKVEPYHKGGFVCSFEVTPNGRVWPEVVIESLALAQLIGRSWVLSGDIENGIDVWSNDSSVRGVQNIHLVVENA